MAEAFELEELQEKVILVGVSEQEGDDAEDSLVELADLVRTAGAQVVGTLTVLSSSNSLFAFISK